METGIGLQIDARTGGERKQFASQLPKIQEWCAMIIKSGYAGNDTPDFYEGLLSGYATSLAILLQMPPENAKELIGSIVSFISSK